MAKSDTGDKSAGKTRGTRTSPSSATANESKQGGVAKGSAGGNPKLSKHETNTKRKGDGLH